MEINGVVVTSDFLMTEDEAQKYIEYISARVDKPLISLKVELQKDGSVKLHYSLQGQKFERIRRITGYLTGDLNSWNNSKRAEEKERVKHGIKEFKNESADKV